MYRYPPSRMRMKNLLELLVRKKNVSILDNRQNTAVENALRIANPPENRMSAKPIREYNLYQQFLRKLLYKDLSRYTYIHIYIHIHIYI